MNFNIPDKVYSYLKKYADCERLNTFSSTNNLYNNIVVIPAINESSNLPSLLASLENLDDKYIPETLFIFVINNTISASDEIKTDNAKSFDILQSHSGKINIYIIDAFSKGRELNDKEGGVGLARKTGMDFALKLFNYSNNRKKILICLDSDCTVSQNYLTAIVDTFNKKNISAASLRFYHNVNGMHSEAIICYELFLRYYVAGLKYASSYYAFHTVGSSMVCDFKSYIKIEGMNKRKAAEDFYFLEKLAKNYEITTIKEAIVFPSSRPSLRVPFGTGQRVNRFYGNTHNEYQLYPFECFKILKKWLLYFNNDDILQADEYLKIAGDISFDLQNFLIEQKFSNAWEKILKNSGRLEQIKKQKVFWFDGFRTLKLIHYLRDNISNGSNMFTALSDMFTEYGIEHNKYCGGIPEPGFQIEYLNILKQID